MSELEGRRLLGRGRAAEVYTWESGTVLRLLLPGGSAAGLEREAAAMDAAAAVGAPVPRVHGLRDVNGRPGMVIDRVDGPDLLTLLGRRPHRVRWAARLLAQVHVALLASPAPPRLRSPHDELPEALHASPLVPADIAANAIALLESLPAGDRLCHGDFHPGNVLVGPGGPAVIDWTGAFRGHPLADHAHTCVLLAAGEPPPGTARPLLVLIAVVRRAFLRVYRAEVAARMSVPPDDLDAWMAVSAANRLREGIAGERGALLALAGRAG